MRDLRRSVEKKREENADRNRGARAKKPGNEPGEVPQPRVPDLGTLLPLEAAERVAAPENPHDAHGAVALALRHALFQ